MAESAPTPKPGTWKVTIGTLAGLLVAALAPTFKDMGFPLDAEAQGALTTIVTAIVVYFMPETYQT